MDSSVDPKQPFFRALMLPWLAHGHLSPFLELAKLLSSSYNIAVFLCSTPVNIQSVRERRHLDVIAFPLIHLVELHLPNSALPAHLHTTKHLPPNLMPDLKTAFDGAAAAFGAILDSVSPHLLIYDLIQPWAPLSAAGRGIPAVFFLPIAASSAAAFCHRLLRPAEQFPFPALEFPETESAEILKVIRKESNRMSDGERLLQCFHRSSGFVAIKTFSEIENKYIEYLSSIVGKEIVPVGPLISGGAGEDGWRGQSYVAEWLCWQEPASVVFVSVGSEYFLTEEERWEMSRGLELSGFSFIWVVRFAGGEGGGLPPSLPARGLVVEGWAPQYKILEHPSVGGFLTHCGWSSVLEGMSNGVPMIALPLQIDQPFNARLMVELGVALEVEKKGGRFSGEEVARCVREVMAGEAGKRVRRRSKEMKGIMADRKDDEIKDMVGRMAALVTTRKAEFFPQQSSPAAAAGLVK
ncbi:Flavanone 7-O-glucoside 2''-O-beta-L-rhamnosyltransferase [Apostasia shenzhenica]|uniref:Glycosyltransferase n=1 Tax=Apostasia shenzhenica TaxID=1088818 RepID=A0A2I0A5S1_9ASPA|nr:Flavanone 7-O-glucoside 2''-O-beta-L-rhamnosyltransferase [Apostasia shenzhenica]